MLRVKRVVIIIVCLMILTLPSVAYADTYKDEEAQIEFTVPDGWTEKGLNEERDLIKVQYVFDPESIYTETIMFGYGDAYGAIPEEERFGVARANLNNSSLTVSDIAYMYGVSGSQVKKAYYNGVDYFELKLTNLEPFGIDIDIGNVYLMRFYDGYMYSFLYYYWPGYDDHYSDFEDMVSSVKYLAETSLPTPTPAPTAVKPVFTYHAPITTYTPYSSGTPDFSAGGLILSLIITVAIYSLPVIVYRYAIRKRPMEKKKAKWFSIIYGVAAFIGMSILLYSLGYGPAGYAIIFWSWVNYKMLSSGIDSMPQSGFNGYTGSNDNEPQDFNIRFTSNKDEGGLSGREAWAEQTPASEHVAPGPLEEKNEDRGKGAGENGAREEDNAADRADIYYDNGAKEISVLQQLEQLNRLYEKGVMTKGEFKDAKKKLLEKL